MVTGSSLDDVKIAAAIDVLGLSVEVAEFHGGICGLLCSGGPGAVVAWMRQSDGSHTAAAAEADSAREQLYEAEAETWRLLSSPEFDFEPLLPPDEADLAERVAALALWCQGFLAGLGLGGIQSQDLDASDTSDTDEGESAALAEIVADLAEISRVAVGSEDLADVNSADFDLLAVREYVRVGAQLVFDVLHRRHSLGAARAESEVTH